MWTNKAVQSMFNKYGTRINSISLNNGKYIFLEYPSSPKLGDVTFETIEGVDVMKIHHKGYSGPVIVEWDSYITTEFIEAIEVMDEKNPDNRLDPLTLK